MTFFAGKWRNIEHVNEHMTLPNLPFIAVRDCHHQVGESLLAIDVRRTDDRCLSTN